MTRLKGKMKARCRAKEEAAKKASREKNRAKYREMILTFDDPALKAKCDDVGSDEDISATVETLKKVLGSTSNGLGLAAPQIGSLKRIFVMRKDTQSRIMKVMINPVIESKSEIQIKSREMCLSYPKVVAVVRRHWEVKVSYLNETMKKCEETFNGLMGQVVQHEIDHLDGICAVGNGWAKDDAMRLEWAEDPVDAETSE